jgi:hypothetical protein
MDKVLRTFNVLDIQVLPQQERPSQQDIDKAQRIAWTMALEAQTLTDDGFHQVLDRIVTRRLRHRTT